MAVRDFDLIVLGAGSGGVRASRNAAALGARVAVAEERQLGGTCVNLGCVPKKLFVYASQVREQLHDAAGFGWSIPTPTFDWPTLIAAKNAEIERLNRVYAKLLDDSGVTRFAGRATLIDRHTVRVGDEQISADHILIATGSVAWRPPIEGANLGITSDECFHLESLPKRLLICGGGYIAVEFAGIFHGLGVEVTQLYRGPLFLRGFDDDLRQTLAQAMRNKGIDLRFDRNVSNVRQDDTGLRAQLNDGTEVACDALLFATGRVPNVAGLGLEQVGVRLGERGEIEVDAFSQTSVENIYAVGDVTDRINLTPVALAEGSAVATTLFGAGPCKADHSNVASAVFSQPEAASVGLTEAQARQQYDAVDVYRSRFRPLKNTVSGREERTMMKLVVDGQSDRVLGCHLVGPQSAEIIQAVAITLKCGTTKTQFDATIGVHPTAAEELVTMRNKLPQPSA